MFFYSFARFLNFCPMFECTKFYIGRNGLCICLSNCTGMHILIYFLICLNINNFCNVTTLNNLFILKNYLLFFKDTGSHTRNLASAVLLYTYIY